MYKQNETGIYVPTVDTIHIVSDDGGTSNAAFMEFTSILIDGHTYTSLNQAISNFCLERAIKSLHARQLEWLDRELSGMDEYADIYTDLFNLVHEELKRATYMLLKSVLLSKSDLDECFANHEEIFKSQFCVTRRGLELFAKAYSYIAFPTVELARSIKSAGKVKCEIHVDRKKEYEAVLGSSVFVNGVLLDVRKAIATLLNAFIKQKLHYQINIGNVEITAFAGCPLVSVVDAFANFTFSFVQSTLSPDAPSESQRVKAEVLREFLSTPEAEDFSSIEERIKESFEIQQGKIRSISDENLVSVFTLGHFTGNGETDS